MTLQQDPPESAEQLAAFVNAKETPVRMFVSMSSGNGKNSFMFSEESASQLRGEVTAQAVASMQEAGQIAGIICAKKMLLKSGEEILVAMVRKPQVPLGGKKIAELMVQQAVIEAEWFRGKKEYEDDASERVRTYWVVGTKIQGRSGKDRDIPWSAAFISYLVIKSGGGTRFQGGEGHWQYVNKAVKAKGEGDNSYGFWGHEVGHNAGNYKPQVGDLVCAWRNNAVTYRDAQRGDGYESHCDIVVAKSGQQIEVIGGNVNEDVSRKTFKLTASGHLDEAALPKAFVILENRMDGPPGTSAGVPLAGNAAVPAAPVAGSIIPVTLDQVRWLAPNAKSVYLQAFVNADAVLSAHEINKNKLRLRHFMAQVLHECGGLTVLEENMNYRAERLMEVWPSRFPTLASAQPYAHDPAKLANNVYANRMGNGNPGSGDGWSYRGRGLLQVTGREDYRKYGGLVGANLEAEPDLAFSAAYTLKIAAAEWSAKNGNELADQNNITGITQRINGGQTGIASRRDWYAKAAEVWV